MLLREAVEHVVDESRSTLIGMQVDRTQAESREKYVEWLTEQVNRVCRELAKAAAAKGA